jgi:cytochrome o ubiquinol oxidase subunit 1
MPLYVLGLMGATRRMQHYDNPAWQPYFVVAAIGALIIFAGIILTVVQLVYSIRTRDRRRDLTGDPWDGRTLEWATLSPPPPFNFAVLPDVHGEEAYWSLKQRAIQRGQLSDEPHYEPIEMPLNSPVGVICAFFTFFCGFALIWHIWWVVVLGLICAFATFVWYAWRDEHEHEIPAAEVARIDRERRRVRAERLRTAEQTA